MPNDCAYSNLPIAPGTNWVTNACYLGMLAGWGRGRGRTPGTTRAVKLCQDPLLPAARVSPPSLSWGSTKLDYLLISSNLKFWVSQPDDPFSSAFRTLIPSPILPSCINSGFLLRAGSQLLGKGPMECRQRGL